MQDFLTLVIWAAIIQGGLMAVLFMTSKQYSSFSNKLLGAFIISLITEATSIFLPANKILGYPIGMYFEFPEVKSLIPLFFIHYVLIKLGVSKKYRPFLKVNYGIAVGILILTLINIISYLFAARTISSQIPFASIEIFFLTYQTYAFILSFSGIYISITETYRYKQLVSNDYSDLDLQAISWLWRFVTLLIPATLLWGAELTRIFIGYYTGTFSQWNFVEITWGILVVFIYFVSYQAFKHQDLFKNFKVPDRDPLLDKTESKSPQSISEEIKAPLLKCMEEEKMYLLSELTVFDVSKRIGLPHRKVSNFINQSFGSNFSEWVNNYRVEEVKKRFEEPTSDNLTIEAIGLESGFKSRSAMYTAFKKNTGYTPAQYKKATLS